MYWMRSWKGVEAVGMLWADRRREGGGMSWWQAALGGTGVGAGWGAGHREGVAVPARCVLSVPFLSGMLALLAPMQSHLSTNLFLCCLVLRGSWVAGSPWEVKGFSLSSLAFFLSYISPLFHPHSPCYIQLPWTAYCTPNALSHPWVFAYAVHSAWSTFLSFCPFAPSVIANFCPAFKTQLRFCLESTQHPFPSLVPPCPHASVLLAFLMLRCNCFLIGLPDYTALVNTAMLTIYPQLVAQYRGSVRCCWVSGLLIK